VALSEVSTLYPHVDARSILEPELRNVAGETRYLDDLEGLARGADSDIQADVEPAAPLALVGCLPSGYRA
jgi:hypothetical protein